MNVLLGSVSTKTTQLEVRKFQGRRQAYKSPQQMRVPLSRVGDMGYADRKGDPVSKYPSQQGREDVESVALSETHISKARCGAPGAKYRSAHLRETVGKAVDERTNNAQRANFEVGLCNDINERARARPGLLRGRPLAHTQSLAAHSLHRQVVAKPRSVGFIRI